MTGWIALAGIGITAGVLLWRGRLARPLWMFAGAAMMLGAAGYAWQGRPGLAGQRVRGNAVPVLISDDLVELRDAMLGRFTGDGAYVIASDGLFRAGNKDAGVKAILLGLGHYPRSLTLWTGLGTALSLHDGAVSPAAHLAFAKAAQLNPFHPAPPFFLGLAYIRSGDFAAARPYWAQALQLTPAGMSYRRDVALRLALLDQFLAETNGMPPSP